MANWAAVAKAVNDRMGELGLTQKRVSELSNVSISTLRKIQHGDPQQRNAVTLTAISRALRLPDNHLQVLADGGEGDSLGLAPAATGRLTALETELAALKSRVADLERRLS